jgi:hypothetical protein
MSPFRTTAETAFVLLSIAAGLLGQRAAHAQEVRVPRVESAEITVDGVLDEPVWSEAAVLTGFRDYVPIDNRPAEDSTHVLVWYSPTAIHFGIRAFEPHGQVRATLADRDKISGDDFIQIVLDTYNDRRQAISIGVNPLGQQADGILKDAEQSGSFRSQSSTGFTTDTSPDFRYESKGRLTPEGYVVEISVPFKSLRYQPGYEQDWGFNVIRRIQHSGYTSTWSAVRQGNASFMAQNGAIVGLVDLRRGLVLDVNPELTAGADRGPGSGSKFDANARDPLGLNVRWGVTNNLTLNGTVNPDFSQVEADAAQIQFDPREAVFIAERRPFFLDGIEQFQSPTNLIYTRRIANPVSAVKLTGKQGNLNVAVLSAVDNSARYLSDLDARYFNAVRLKRDLSGQNSVGMVYTDKIDGDHWNRVAALDGRLVWSKIWSMTWQGAMSFTGGGTGVGGTGSGETVSAPMWRLALGANGRKYGATLTSTGFHGQFNAESGFIQRVDVAQATFVPRRTWFGDEGDMLESFTFGLTFDGRWDYDRFTQGTGPNDRKLHFNTGYSLKGGWSGGTSIFYESFKYPYQLYTDYFVELQENGVPVDTVAYTGTDRLTNLGFWTTLNTPRLNAFSANIFLVGGRDDNFFEWAPADIYFATITLNYNPTDQLRAQLLYNHQHYVRADDKSTVGLRRVPRLRVEYQITPSFFVRLVGEYDSNFRDELRDNSRTDDPILILDRETGTYHRTQERERNIIHVDWLLSYRPSPGTVFFLGYGNTMSEPESFQLRNTRRLNDGLFMKLSYVFRVK